MLPIYLVDRNVSSQTIGLWTGIYGQSLSIMGSILSGFILKKTNKSYSTYSWLQFSASIRIVPIVLITDIIILFENSNKNDLNGTYSLDTLLFLVMVHPIDLHESLI